MCRHQMLMWFEQLSDAEGLFHYGYVYVYIIHVGFIQLYVSKVAAVVLSMNLKVMKWFPCSAVACHSVVCDSQGH